MQRPWFIEKEVEDTGSEEDGSPHLHGSQPDVLWAGPPH